MVTLWALKGFASALGERLANAPGDKVQLRTLTPRIEEIQAMQQQMQASNEQMQESITVAFERFEKMLDDNPAFRTRRDSASFRPTPDAPTIGVALLELDSQIEALRAKTRVPAVAEPDTRDASPAPTVVTPRDPNTTSLDGLDEEIALLRRRRE